jgi:cytochrome P450
MFLLLAPAHVWRALRNPDFCRAYPVYTRALRTVLAIEAVLLAVGAWLAPRAGAIAALMLVASAIWLRWRGRPVYGIRRGLPPGSLDFLAPGPFLDPRFYLTAARAYRNVFKCSALARSQVCISSLAAGYEILRIHAAHLRPLSLPFHRYVPGGFLRRMDDPAHEAYRRLFSAVLSRSLVEHWRPILEAASARGLARLDEACSAPGSAGEPPLPHIERIVFDSWMSVFFGIDGESQEAADLRELFAVIDIRNQDGASGSAVRAALDGIEDRLRHTILGVDHSARLEEARATCVLREIVDRKPDALSDTTAVRNLIYMFSTSAGDVSGLLLWVLKHLSDHPEWIDRLRADAAGAGERHSGNGLSLAARIVSETLRLQQSEFVMREITGPIRHRGFRFPRGWLLRICVQESHRNPDVFERPEEFDPDRFLRKPPTRDQYAPFGLDRHGCIGEHLARGMADVFAGQLAGCQWEVTSDGPTEMSSWRHWAPSSRFRIRLAIHPRLTQPP